MEIGGQELATAIDAAQNGYWLPIGILATAWGVIISLLLYIYNRNQKENEKRHSENTAILKALTETSTDLKTMVKVNQVRLSYLEKHAS